MRYFLIASLILSAVAPCAIAESGFEGKLIVEDVASEYVNVGKYDPGHTEFRLVEDYAYVAADGRKWVVPKGTVVNGASIPKAFWSVVGGPWSGEYRNATVLHDYMCETRNESSDFTHRLFYEALRANGVSLALAKIMYYAVREGGPKWDITTRLIEPRVIRDDVTEEEVKKIISEVALEDPTLDEIDRKTR
jgi:hypothetical protein